MPGPVLGLQRAVVAVDDQLDQLVHEGLVAIEVLRLAEVRASAGSAGSRPRRGRRRPAGSRGGRASPAGRLAASATRAGGTQTSSMISGTPGRAHAASRPCMPSRTCQSISISSALAAEARAHRSVVGRRGSRSACALGPVELRSVVGAELDQQRRRVGRQLLPALGRPRHVPGGGDQGRGDHQLGRARAGRDQLADRRRRPCRCPRRRLSDERSCGGRAGTVSKTASADEGQRPLRADQQAPEDLQRRRRRRGTRTAGSRSCS